MYKNNEVLLKDKIFTESDTGYKTEFLSLAQDRSVGRNLGEACAQ